MLKLSFLISLFVFVFLGMIIIIVYVWEINCDAKKEDINKEEIKKEEIKDKPNFYSLNKGKTVSYAMIKKYCNGNDDFTIELIYHLFQQNRLCTINYKSIDDNLDWMKQSRYGYIAKIFFIGSKQEYLDYCLEEARQKREEIDNFLKYE